MVDVTARPAAVVTARQGSYVDWPCVVGGAILGVALSSTLMAFGSAIGLSMVSPWKGLSSSGTTIAVLIALWTVTVQIASFALGGYVAARMRHAWQDASADEVEFRDGTHGLLVWATGVVIAAIIAGMVTSGAARSVADAASSAIGSTNTQGIAQQFTDMLLRPAPNAPANASDPNQSRAEVTRLLVASATRGTMEASDKTYLAQVVAARAGISQQDAEARVNSAIASAKDAVDRARKLGVVAAFLTAASLMAGAAVAWGAARTGGEHRDRNTTWRGFTRRRELRETTSSR